MDDREMIGYLSGLARDCALDDDDVPIDPADVMRLLWLAELGAAVIDCEVSTEELTQARATLDCDGRYAHVSVPNLLIVLETLLARGRQDY